MNAETNYLKVIGVFMNVLIFYASYGGGHLSAANALRQYIEKNYGFQNDKKLMFIYNAETINENEVKVVEYFFSPNPNIVVNEI